MKGVTSSLDHVLAAHGLSLRGGFHPGPDDGVPEAGEGAPASTVLLVGNVGADLWPHFAPHAHGPDALDRWTVSVLGPIAEAFGARVVYPFDTPPLPFQRWAIRAGPVAPSPLGILIHPEHGLWHAYRAALLFAERMEMEMPPPRTSPCEACDDKPCLSACPVGAFTGEAYDVAACAAHLASPSGARCLYEGCLARGACPVGTPYPLEQIRFHMAAFGRAVA